MVFIPPSHRRHAVPGRSTPEVDVPGAPAESQPKAIVPFAPPVPNPAAKPAALTPPSAPKRPTDLDRAPPRFRVGAVDAVFVDVQSTEAALTIDAQAQTIRGAATVQLTQPSQGYPVIDLRGTPTSITVDGRVVDPALYRPVSLPGGGTAGLLRVDLAPGAHRIEINYSLEPRDLVVRGEPAVVFTPHFEFMMRMTDLDTQANYLERYAPANLLFDRHAFSMRVQVTNAPQLALLSNGQSTSTQNAFAIRFANDTIASTPFLHIFDPATRTVERTMFMSRDGRQIPIIAYGRNAADVRRALAELVVDMGHMERTMGAYPHQAFVAHIRSGPDTGGMEYAGATDASLLSLRHELIHSWIGRSIVPADGESGWIDEALTSWLDEYFHGRRASGDTLPRLHADSVYQRHTSPESYAGVALVTRLDVLFASRGGIVTLLPSLYSEFNGRTISVAEFVAFLRRQAGTRSNEVDAIFREADALPAHTS